jgi:hypothetical protein
MPDLSQINWEHTSATVILGLIVTAFLRGWIVSKIVYQLLVTRLEESERDRRSLVDTLQKLLTRLDQ